MKGFLLSLLLSLTIAQDLSNIPPGVLRQEEHLVDLYLQHHQGRSLEERETTEVECYVHFVKSSNGTGATMDMLIDNMQVLNDAFDPYYHFTVRETTETIDDDLYFINRPGGRKDRELRPMLHRGTSETLNIYLVDSAGFGFSSFPLELPFYGIELDGVTLNFNSMPGQRGTVPADNYQSLANEGKTLVHEVGHWLGLYHVQQFNIYDPEDPRGGCQLYGDFVLDTPASFGDVFGCPIGLDSCPDMPGEDPIHNYMHYTDDACRYEFTPGQRERTFAMWDIYRKIYRVVDTKIEFCAGAFFDDFPCIDGRRCCFETEICLPCVGDDDVSQEPSLAPTLESTEAITAAPASMFGDHCKTGSRRCK